MSKSPLIFHEVYESRPCPVCGDLVQKTLFTQRFDQFDDTGILSGYDIVVCTTCGAGFASHLPDQSEFDQYYKHMSKYEHSSKFEKDSIYDVNRFRLIIDMILPYLDSLDTKILDIGCSTAKLLFMLREKGFTNITGLDPSPVCADLANKRYGIKVITGSISVLEKIKDLSDFVIISHVLEHVRDLNSSMAQIRTIISPNGLVYIEVPDATEFANWPDAPFQEFSIEHVNFFSITSLKNLMHHNGFETVYCQKAQRVQNYGTVMPVLSAIFRKKEAKASTLELCEETESGLVAYINKSKAVEEHIHKVIDELVESGEAIIVWGTGTHTLRLLATSKLSKANISAFVDSNAHYQGRELAGRRILDPLSLKNTSETILISSRFFQKDILDLAKNRLKLTNKFVELYDL